jgi:hypothetical protein
MTVHTRNYQGMVRFFLFLAMAILLDFSVWAYPSASLAADPVNSTPNAPLQGPVLAPDTSALAQESANQKLSTAPGSSNLIDEDTHSDLIDEVDEAIPLPERSGTATHTRDTSHPPALLELFNYPIAIFRGSLYGFTPADRERANEARLDRFLEEEYSGVITTDRRAEGIMILIDGKNALMMIPGDVDPFTDQTLEEYVEEVVTLLDVALKAAKEQHSTAYLLRATGLSLLAMLIYGLLIWGVHVLQRRVRPHILQLEHTFSKKMRQGGFFVLLHLGSITFWLMRVVFWVLLVGLAFKWLSFCLQQFPYTRYWGDQLDDNFLAFLGEAVRGIVGAVPDLLIIAAHCAGNTRSRVVSSSVFRGDRKRACPGGMDGRGGRTCHQTDCDGGHLVIRFGHDFPLYTWKR